MKLKTNKIKLSCWKVKLENNNQLKRDKKNKSIQHTSPQLGS
jgi:hypothetical protein